MSNQHLWNLLQGRVVVTTDDVVLEELRENVIRLTTALTYYKPYQQEAEDKGRQKQMCFPAMPKFIREDVTENLEQSSSSSLTMSSSKREKVEGDGVGLSKSQSGLSSFEQLRKAVAQRLDLDIKIAEELLMTYMMFEYKGSSTTYDSIVDTHRSFLQFLKELTDFYMRERTCLLLCIQSILARVGDEEDPLYNIIENFRSVISTSNWCQGLLSSIPVAKSELELIEILHCLLLLTYKLPEESIPKFFSYFHRSGFSSLRKSEGMKMAEGAVMYSALLVAGLTDCCSSVIPTSLFSKEMKEFLRKHLDNLLLNPFNIAPVVACYDLFCKDDPELTQKMERIPCNPALTFNAMIKLVEKYGQGSLSDRHSISLVLSSSVFEAFEALLAHYDCNHFGTKAQAFLILAKILEHNDVAENFMCGPPPALTILYTEATKLFPIDVASTLLMWKSLCMSVRNKEDCSMLISGVAKLNCIAEFLVEDDLELSTRRKIGTSEMLNEKTRTVFGIVLERGTRGTLNNTEEDGDGIPYISWELPSSSSSNLNAFSAIRSIIEPMAEQLVEMGNVGNSILKGGADLHFDFDYMPQVLFPVAEFVIHFMQNTDTAIDEVNFLVHPICIILERMVKLTRDYEERGKLIKYLLGIVEAVNEFSEEKIILFNYIHENLQGGGGETVMNVIENLILRRESVSSTNCEVTLAFLNLIASFSENEKTWKENQQFHSKILNSITFISQNILPTLSTWRLGNEGIRLQIYSKCLKLFTSIFSLEGNTFTRLKRESLKFLIAPDSFLLKLLGTEECLLQTSIINPTLETQLVGQVVCFALKLLHKIILFEKRVLLRLDQLLEGTLVRLLGLFTRHRLNPMVPTISIMILKGIAEHSNISLLAGFGKDQNAFRDVMLQRLEFIAEDINLKISVLDFLTVASQTQISIMHSFFKDGVLESNALELIHQDNEELCLACLNLFRSLFRQNFILASKAHSGFWTKIMGPLNHQYSSLSRNRERFPEIVTATLHILIFEMYNNNCKDSHFGTELEQFLKNEKVKLVVEAVLAEQNEQATKCLVAFSQFFLLLLGRPQLSSKFVSSRILMDVRKLILENFWKECDDEEDIGWDQNKKEKCRRRSKTLVELVTILTTEESSSSPQFMRDLLLKLLKVFKFLSFGVKLAVLCLLNKCYFLCNQKLVGDGIIENTLRLIRTVWKNSSVNLVDLMGEEENHLILVGAATLLKTIVEKQPNEVWAQAFKQELVALSLLSVCCVGIKMEKGPNVVSASLATLIALAEDSQGYILLPSNGMSNSLWLHLHKFTVEGGSGRKSGKEWADVFILCFNFNSKLLTSLKRDYLDEALAFWGLFSTYIYSKLMMMMSLTEICLKGIGMEGAGGDVKALLSTNFFVLNGILNMMPYLEDWQRSQRAEVFKMIKMVFHVLQEACGLLRQPLLLQSSKSFGFSEVYDRATSLSPSKAEARTTPTSPELMELQGRLWEICDLCIHILVKLKGKQDEFIEKGVFIPTMLQVGQLCIKSLATVKDSLGVSGMNRISSVLEKVMLTVHNFTVPVLEDATIDIKLQIAFRREWSTEVVSLIDGIRRLGIPKNDFLVDICSRMETKFK